MGTKTEVIKTTVDDYDKSELPAGADTETLELTWRGKTYNVVTSEDNAKVVTEWLDNLTDGADEKKRGSGPAQPRTPREAKDHPLQFAKDALGLQGFGSDTKLAKAVDAYLASIPESDRPLTELTKKPISTLSKQAPQKNLIPFVQDHLEAIVALYKGEGDDKEAPAKKTTSRAKAS